MTAQNIGLGQPPRTPLRKAGADLSPTRLAWALVMGALVAAALITVSLDGPAPSAADTWHGNVQSSGWTATPN